jgi:hypothetical protein
MKKSDLVKRVKVLEDYVESMFQLHEPGLCTNEKTIAHHLKKLWEKNRKGKRK